MLTGTTLEDFLAEGQTGSSADRLRQFGEGAGLVGIVVAVGLIVFLAHVHRGRRQEISSLLAITGAMGGLAVAGGVIEVIGVARQFQTSWVDALALDAGTAPMLRLLSGVLLLLGLFDHVRPVAGESTDHEWSHRWALDAASAFGVAGLAVGVFSFAFDGHTVTRGARGLHAVVNAIHVVAGGVWLGGLVGLAVVGAVRHRRHDQRSLAALVVRFSSDATLALILVAAAGLAMSAMIIDEIGDYTGTVWGRRLLLKVAAVAVAAGLGGYNRFVLVPKLRHDPDDPDDPALERAARTTIVIEALLLVFVAVATVALVNATPNP